MKPVIVAVALAGVGSVAAAPSTAVAAPFRPFVDAVGVAPDGAIVATTTAAGQGDPPISHRHTLVVFAPDGVELIRIDAERHRERGLAIGRRQWRGLDGWLGTMRLRRVAVKPLAELRCRARPDPDEVACPANPPPLVRTPTGLARWNPDGASPIWGWGEPLVAEVGNACIVLEPDNNGLLDRTVPHAVPCPPPP